MSDSTAAGREETTATASDATVQKVLLPRHGGHVTTVLFSVGTNYKLLEAIGTGAYGVVCSAVDKKTGEVLLRLAAMLKASCPCNMYLSA